jgi:Cof subfamily protein (haloacid dehalogenase superfamily)
MIRSLFFDIDGTLVSFKTHAIPDSTIAALTAAKAKGVKIFISTGRPMAIINNLNAIEHLIDGYMTTNGALCFVGENEVCSHPIPKDDVNILIEDSMKNNYSCIIVGRKDFAVLNPQDIVIKIFRGQLNVTNITETKPVDEVLSGDVFQLTPFFNVAHEQTIMPKLTNCVSGRWNPAFTDITAIEADKGKGLEAIADFEHINISETMAFGDGGNDIAIIKKAGIGVAMGNANPELKEVADYITSSVDEDGVKNALLHYGVI